MKKFLHVVLPLLLVLVMALPLSTLAAEETTITGYAFDYDSTLSQNGGYRSKWVGSQFSTWASYAHWVKSEGDFQGPIQWAPGITADHVKLDSTEGILTFSGVTGGNIQLNVVQNTKVKEGVAPFTIIFETKPSKDAYAGMSISAMKNKAEITLFWIDTDGTAYWGTSGVKTSPTGYQLTADEWNTVRLYAVPTYDKKDATLHTGFRVYMDVRKTDECIEDWAISEEDLTALPHSDWAVPKVFLNGSDDQEVKPLIKGYRALVNPDDKDNSPERSFNFRDFRVLRMKAGETLYKTTFDGYPNLTAYVPASGNSDTSVITAPTAEGVSFWVSGEGMDADYLQPGDTKRVVASKVYQKASGDQLQIATLMAAINRLDAAALENDEYTYAEMSASKTEIETKLQKAINDGIVSETEGGAYYEYYVSANDRIGILDGKMTIIATNAEALIAAAAIFSDDDADLDERLAAYEEIKEMPVDETYSEECKTAILNRDVFAATYQEIGEPYKIYKENRGKLLLEQTDEELRQLLLLLIKNIAIIKESGASFTPDKSFTTKYEAYLASQTQRIKETNVITEKYRELERLVELYNTYNKSIGKQRKIVPVVQEAVTDYNNAIARINAEIITAARLAGACSLEVTQNTAFGRLIANVTATVNKSTPLPTKSEEN